MYVGEVFGFWSLMEWNLELAGLCVILTFDNFVVDFIEFGGCHLDEAGFAAVDAHEHL